MRGSKCGKQACLPHLGQSRESPQKIRQRGDGIVDDAGLKPRLSLQKKSVQRRESPQTRHLLSLKMQKNYINACAHKKIGWVGADTIEGERLNPWSPTLH